MIWERNWNSLMCVRFGRCTHKPGFFASTNKLGFQSYTANPSRKHPTLAPRTIDVSVLEIEPLKKVFGDIATEIAAEHANGPWGGLWASEQAAIRIFSRLSANLRVEQTRPEREPFRQPESVKMNGRG